MIKGLTDTHSERFPTIGRICKGAKVESANGGTRPVDLDYFSAVFAPGEELAGRMFKQAYGEKPREVHIYLPSDNLAEMWKTQYEAYITGRMVAASDGEWFTYLVDLATFEVIVSARNKDAQGRCVNIHTGQPEPHRLVVGQTRRGDDVVMKATGRLTVIVTELGRFATLEVRTSSVLDVMELTANLNVLGNLNGGRLMGVPMILKRRPKEISYPNANGGRSKKVSWLLSIEADPRFVAYQLWQFTHSFELPAGMEEVHRRDAEEEEVEVEGEFKAAVNMSEPLPKGQSYHVMDEAGRRVY